MADPVNEVTIGPLVFEYDPKTRYLGIGNGQELFGTAEVSEDVWEAFIAVADTSLAGALREAFRSGMSFKQVMGVVLEADDAVGEEQAGG